jgi:hypothetical protein
MIDSGMLEAVAAALGLPEDVVERLLSEVGLPLVVELRVFVGDEVFVGYKQGLFVTDGCVENCDGLNPPPPQVEIYRDSDRADARWVTARAGSEPFECQPCDRDDTGTCTPTTAPAIPLDRGGRYILAPEEDVPQWTESYTILSLSGEFIQAEEAGYFSWFTNSGALQEEQTRFPAAEEVYVAPETPGSYVIWVVVRDGHYGQSACRIPIEVR